MRMLSHVLADAPPLLSDDTRSGLQFHDHGAMPPERQRFGPLADVFRVCFVWPCPVLSGAAESFGHVVLTARRMAACTTCARPEDPGSENDPGAHVSRGATESGLKSRTPLRRCPRPTSWLSIGVGCAVACSVRPGGCSCAVAGSPKAGPVRLAATASSITSLVRRRPFEPDSHGNPRTDQRQKVPPAHDAGETATPCPLPGSGARSPITAALSSVPPPSIFRTTAPASKRASWIRL